MDYPLLGLLGIFHSSRNVPKAELERLERHTGMFQKVLELQTGMFYFPVLKSQWEVGV
jgi:hypothetical protein